MVVSNLTDETLPELSFLTERDREIVMFNINSRIPIKALEVIFRSETGEVVVGILTCTFFQNKGESCLKIVITDITKQKFQEIAAKKLNEMNQLEHCSVLAYC